MIPDRLDPNLLREYADGELVADRAAAVSDRLQAEDAAGQAGRAQVLMERRLREHVRRVMAGSAAPQQLRDCVAQVINADAVVVGSNTEPIARIGYDGIRSARSAGRTSIWRTMFAAPQRANALAIAAVLALISGVVLYSIFAPTIDEARSRGPSASDLVADAAEYADGEHGECTVNAERLQRKADWLTKDQATTNLSDLLHTPVDVVDLSSLGYQFVGAGRSSLPLERVPSGHLIYRKSRPNGQTAGMVSIFVAPATGCCKKMCEKLKPREWRSASDSARLTHRVLYSTDRTLMYFLVCCDENDLEPVARIIAQAGSSN